MFYIFMLVVAVFMMMEVFMMSFTHAFLGGVIAPVALMALLAYADREG